MSAPQPHQPQPPLSTPAYVPAQTLSATTRQLCCAPYVDIAFANDVIREVVEEERRAVPPSFGFDLDPVVRHCLRARRLLIGRYGVVTLLVAIGLCAAPQWTLPWLAICGIITCARSVRFQRLGTAVIALCCCAVLWTTSVNALISGTIATNGVNPDGTTLSPVQQRVQDFLVATTGGVFQVLPFALGIFTFLALFLYRRRAYDILATELAPGVQAVPPPVHSARVARRLAIVAAIQRGNVTVQERYPFLGSGTVTHGWSFAITLRPPGEHQGARTGGHPVPRIAIDGVLLHQRVRDAVLGLRDAVLPDGEKIPGLFVTPHVVADGVRAGTDPLINPHTAVPHTLASDAAIRAVIGCPQGGLRHYDRIVVPAAGKAVHTGAGQLVVPAQDLGIGVTAYAHFAVEGGMLYAEFMATVLPPVQARFTRAPTPCERFLRDRRPAVLRC
jgi:hypothetical protein